MNFTGERYVYMDYIDFTLYFRVTTDLDQNKGKKQVHSIQGEK